MPTDFTFEEDFVIRHCAQGGYVIQQHPHETRLLGEAGYEQAFSTLDDLVGFLTLHKQKLYP